MRGTLQLRSWAAMIMSGLLAAHSHTGGMPHDLEGQQLDARGNFIDKVVHENLIMARVHDPTQWLASAFFDRGTINQVRAALLSHKFVHITDALVPVCDVMLVTPHPPSPQPAHPVTLTLTAQLPNNPILTLYLTLSTPLSRNSTQIPRRRELRRWRSICIKSSWTNPTRRGRRTRPTRPAQQPPGQQAMRG